MSTVMKGLMGMGLLAVVLVILLIIAKPQGEVPKTPKGGSVALAAAESSYDFGTISMKNGKVTHDFKISNTSGSPVHLTKMYTSCMCTAAVWVMDGAQKGPYGMPGMSTPMPDLNMDMPVGGEGMMRVTFDPNAHGPSGVGPISREVTLETTGGSVVVSFKANVTP